ncbi:conserved hypothetical protein [Cupriavidus taiwanensis]|uniref:Uncharacterized protein n=1 Tax=Cupriavidus taiwanensis TaxID=164546 RepID=A0A375DWW6_9BURK|nr:hypothetical protein [Cupriavidus taiwanensis]SOZ49321.1 conserved hypothetical protein [Cupriavidus taiwanensis]SOZ49384.1 conserved hypothetical protein [Cupriavidus taiwanensis]SOZ51984.1 conserved hypothetical protein [Cupriavidus taiwanensis]SPA07158.1 conserved hypothetical protein [Cupriavidus taiwanensis]
MNLTEAFRQFRAKPRNIRYDVTAISDTNPPELVCALFGHWKEWTEPRDDLPANVREYRDDLRGWGQSPAIAEVRRHLQQAFEGRMPVRVIVVTLLNPTKDQATVDAGQNASAARKVFAPRPDMVGRVTEFDGEAFCIRFKVINPHKLSLMRREAERRLADADRLDVSDPLGDASDSAHLLRLLGVELLLKYVHEAVLGHAPKLKHPLNGHSYEAIFAELPDAMQTRLLQVVGECVGPSGLAHDAVGIFSEWGRNFIGLRYPHEKYEVTEDEYRELGEDWVAIGAPLGLATFRYHPKELTGFVHALRTIADELPPGAREYPDA